MEAESSPEIENISRDARLFESRPCLIKYSKAPINTDFPVPLFPVMTENDGLACNFTNVLEKEPHDFNSNSSKKNASFLSEA